MKNIGLRHLRCFLETARFSSVSAAAEALALSQPAVSKTLREMEERLGVKLFERVGRQIRMSAAGRKFQTHAGLALAELQRGLHALGNDTPSGEPLAIGVLPTVATRIVPAAALAFAREDRQTTLRISTGPNWLLLSQLREGALELVVGRLPAPHAMQGLVFEQLILEPIIVAGRLGHPILTAPKRALAEFPLILPPPDTVIRPAVDAYFNSIGQQTPAAPVETVSLAIGRALLCHSDALWFISRGVVADEIEAGRLVEVRLTSSATLRAGPVGLTRRAGEDASAAAMRFMAALRRSAAAAPGAFLP